MIWAIENAGCIFVKRKEFITIMISRDFFDISTLIIYVIMAISSAVFIKKGALLSQPDGMYSNNRIKLNRWHILFIIVLTMFATFRCVGSRIGGTDAMNYIREFEGSSSITQAIFNNTLSIKEFVFAFYTFVLRCISPDYHLYFFVSYLFIAFTYICFFCKYANKIESKIPYVYLFFFFLKTFCSLRTGLAVAVFLWAIIFIDKKILSALLMICAVFVHRATIIYAMFYLFYWLFQSKIKRKSGRTIFAFCVAIVFLMQAVAMVLKPYILQLGFINATDYYYIASDRGGSIFTRWIMFLPQILLLFIFLFFKKRNDDTANEVISTCVIFDIIIIPFALSMGLFRANEYMFMPRLVLWSHYVTLIETRFIAKTRANKLIYRGIVFALFMAWFLFRLTHEWYDLGIMYYRLGGII